MMHAQMPIFTKVNIYTAALMALRLLQSSKQKINPSIMPAYNSPKAEAPTTNETPGSQSDNILPVPSRKEEGLPKHADSTTPQEAAVPFDTSDYPTGIPLFLITSALVFVMFASNLDTTIITTAIPRITQDFQSVDE
jgi:hypothetical protein